MWNTCQMNEPDSPLSKSAHAPAPVVSRESFPKETSFREELAHYHVRHTITILDGQKVHDLNLEFHITVIICV